MKIFTLAMQDPSWVVIFFAFMRIFFPLALCAASCYLLIIVPQQHKTRHRKQLESKLKRGVRIITSQGLCGIVCNVSSNSIIILLDEGRKIEISPHAIVKVVDESS